MKKKKMPKVKPLSLLWKLNCKIFIIFLKKKKCQMLFISLRANFLNSVHFFRMLVAQQSEYTIERRTRKTTVRNNNIAKLMYYLNCVKQLVSFDIPKFLIDYQNYDDLDSDDKNAVLLYAWLLASDDLLRHNVIVQVSSLPGEFNNEFLDVARDKKGLTMTPELIFGERRVCTRQIMLCNQY